MPPSVTAAPHDITIDGTKYSMSPLQDADFEQLNNWVRSCTIQIARQSLTDDMSQKERDELLGVAIREARKLNYLSPEGRTSVASVEGTAQLLWLGIRHNHPSVTASDIKVALMRDGNGALEAMAIWEEINMGESSSSLLAVARRSQKKESTPS